MIAENKPGKKGAAPAPAPKRKRRAVKKHGRGQSYTAAEITRLKSATLEEIASGVSKRFASAAAGYSWPTFLQWEAKDPEFKAAVAVAVEANLASAERDLQSVSRGADGNVVALIFKLCNRTRHMGESEAVWRHVQHVENKSKSEHTERVEISIEQAAAKVRKEDAVLVERLKRIMARRGVDPKLAVQHESAKSAGGNGGNGGNGHG